MKSRALVIHDTSSPGGKLVPRMLVLFEPAKVTALGDPTTFAGAMARDIMTQYAAVQPDDIPQILADFEDHYQGRELTYGGKVEFVDYEGAGKERVDTIRDKFLADQTPPKDQS